MDRAVFTFLENLRKSGAVNMHKAAPRLQEEFRLEEAQADAILEEWLEGLAWFKGAVVLPMYIHFRIDSPYRH